MSHWADCSNNCWFFNRYQGYQWFGILDQRFFWFGTCTRDTVDLWACTRGSVIINTLINLYLFFQNNSVYIKANIILKNLDHKTNNLLPYWTRLEINVFSLFTLTANIRRAYISPPVVNLPQHFSKKKLTRFVQFCATTPSLWRNHSYNCSQFWCLLHYCWQTTTAQSSLACFYSMEFYIIKEIESYNV